MLKSKSGYNSKSNNTEVTVTLPPTVTLTATPSFTATPIFTPTPDLTPAQQTALDSANADFAATGWEALANGEVTGAPEGVHYNVDKGVYEYTHESFGVVITEPLIPNTEDSVKPDGVVTNLQGYTINENRELVRKKMMGVDEVTGKEFETNVEVYSLQAVIQILLAELAKNPDVDRAESKNRMNSYLDPFTDVENNAFYFTCNGVRLPVYNPVVGSFGLRADSWVYDQELNKIPAPFYAYVSVREDGKNACVVTEIDGVRVQIAIDRPKLTDSKMGEGWWRIE